MGLGVGVHDRLQEALVFFAAPVMRADQRLATAHDGGLGLRVDPRQHLRARLQLELWRGELQLEL